MQFRLLFKFLRFRLRQISRLLKDTGYFISVFLFIILLAIFFGLSKLSSEQSFLFIPIYLALSLPFHFKRTDNSFLLKLAVPKKVIWAIGYNLIVFPVTILLLYNLQWRVALFGHVLATLTTFLPNSFSIKQRFSGNSRVVALIPNHLFEWKSFFRRRKFTFLIYYLLTASLCFSVIAESIGILILLAILSEVYNRFEPKELMEIYPDKSPFLWSKLKAHSLFIHLTFLPLYILFAVFHYQFWYLLVFLIILAELSLCFCLLYKYSQIQTSNLNVHNQFPFAVFFIASILFLPIGCLFIFLYWTKTKQALPDYVRG